MDLRLHTIIYGLVDQIEKAMAGLFAPIYKGSGNARLRSASAGRKKIQGLVLQMTVGSKDSVEPSAGCY